ncbi:ectopic P granules protein 5 homolog isoform X2 [Ptychodera flava]|uniref:ectopic P granules protein 5 homolog isoform X2 n=1 Tax=Ptychodera flava TaxID=63121 RepID=UPI00396A721C
MAEAVKVKTPKRAKKKTKSRDQSTLDDKALELPEPPTEIPGTASAEEGEDANIDGKSSEDVESESDRVNNKGNGTEGNEESVEIAQDKGIVQVVRTAESDVVEDRGESDSEQIRGNTECEIHADLEDDDVSHTQSGEVSDRVQDNELETAEDDTGDPGEVQHVGPESPTDAPNVSDDFTSWERVTERGETKSMLVPEEEPVSPAVQPSAPMEYVSLSPDGTPAVTQPEGVEAIMQPDQQRVDQPRESDTGGAAVTEVSSTPLVDIPTSPAPSSFQTDDARVIRDVRSRLYPDVGQFSADEATVEPFSENELKLYYFNPQLQTLDGYVDQFIQDCHQERHEFFELVYQYYRSRHNLVAIEKDIHYLQKDYSRLKETLWIVTDNVINAQGQCTDRVRVTEQYSFKTVEFSKETGDVLARTLKDARSLVHDKLSLCAYTVQLSQLQVESYIHNLFARSSVLCELDSHAPVTAHASNHGVSSAVSDVQTLKQCISVLFTFYRRPVRDEEFITMLQQWTKRLVASLLRVASLEDHVFLMNHIIRCPAGISKWATPFVQLVLPSSLVGASRGRHDWGDPLLDHFMCMLACLMLPVKGREDFLAKLKVTLTPEPDALDDEKGFTWTLVDEDGEEDEDPNTSWMLLHENDLVSLLDQFPFSAMFKHILLIDDSAEKPYDIHRVTSFSIMKLIAFGTNLVQLLGKGFKTFNRSRYRQFVKRIGRLIRHTVQYIADHWENYKIWRLESMKDSIDAIPLMEPHNKQHSIKRLQVEFDHFFLRAVQCILSDQRHGAWQFMTDMPYKSVSSHMMWHLLWMLHQGTVSEEEIVDRNLTAKEYLYMVRDIDNRIGFEEKLTSMPTSEVIYLLTSFAFMARSRPTTEKDFIETITLEVYELAYVSSHTRQFCCKVGRDLLSSIATIHPFIMSTLLHQVKKSLEAVGMMSTYLYQSLPLHLWTPSEDDMALIRVWLLDHSLSSAENQLARLILAKMNWGFNHQEDALYLDLKLHRNTAILVVEAYAKYIMEKGGGIIADTFKQLSYLTALAPGMRSDLSPEQQLSSWCWEMVLKLRLHQLEQPQTPLAAYDHPTDWSKDLPDMTSDPSLHPILKGTQANGPLACYVAVAMTTVGHSVDLFLSEGLKLVWMLVTTGYYKAVIHVMSLVVPMFLNQSQYLLQNEKFQKIVQCIVQSDRSSAGLTSKLTMSQTFPGKNTKIFSAMIMYQLQCAGSPGGVTRNDVLEFWIRSFTSVEFWNTDRDIQYLMDVLIRAAFTYKGAENIILDVLFSLYKSLLSANKEQGVLSSVFSWMVSGNSMPSLMEKPSAEWPWLAYGILCVESRYEEDSQLRSTVCTLLSRDSKLTPDAAVKKASSKLKLPYSPAASRLMVYRWVYQALETPMDHPLLPILWQRFFMVYLQRQAAEQGLPQRGSIGLRFYESLTNSSLLKRCKKRLVQTADYHHNASKKAAANRYDSTDSDEGPSEQAGDDTPQLDNFKMKYRVSAEFHQSLVKLYQTFILWIDEPRLHDASLYLPALPPQYDSEKLLKILHNEQDMWTEFIDPVRAEYETVQLVSHWIKQCKSIHYTDTRRASLFENSNDQSDSAESRITTRLKQYEPSQPPPAVVELKAPVPEISQDVVNDSTAMLRELEGGIRTLVQYAGVFNTREANHIALDCNYIDVLPELYYHKPTDVQLQIPCKSSFNPNHKCSGPASVTLNFREMTMNSITARKIEENREEYKQLLQESMSPPPVAVCSSAVHIENAITVLITCVRGKTVEEKQSLAAHQSGVELFYTLAAKSDDDIRHYPPTRQFFSSCLEILGQEFIRDTPNQSEQLLGVMLEKPVLAGQLAPNFIPNSCTEEFVNMYSQITKIPPEESDLAFMLLTKFDVPRWFHETKPILSLRSRLADVIGSALCRCGQEPDVQIQMLFEMYRSHFQLILKYQFPDHYGDVLRILLQGSEKGQMSPVCWNDLLRSLGCTYNRQEGMDEDKQRIECLIQTQSLLTQEQIKETIEWMTSYFQKLRVSSTDIARFGLYSKWRPYIKSLSNFLGFLSQTYIVKEAERVIAIGMGIEQAIDQLWKITHELFTPWIITIETLTTTGSQLVAPWLESDGPIATDMVALFTESLQCLQVQFRDILPHYTRDALSLFWPYYVSVLAHKGVVDHVLRVYHARFITLQWSHFYPRLEAVELMLKLHAESSPDCFTFLGCIFPQMKWTDIVDHYARNESPEVASRLHVSLLLLFVMFAKEKTLISTNTEMQSLMTTAESFQWAYVDANAYENTIQWQLTNTDPDIVLADRRGMEDRGLKLLRAAGGFRQDVTVSADTHRKRCSYIRCVVQMICKCSHSKEVRAESFKIAIHDLMQDIESIASVAVDTNAMALESVDLLVEILNLLNNCSPTGRAIEIVKKTLLDWIESNSCSVLLLPCITAACRTLASLKDMSVIVEACMDSYFNSGIDLSQFGGWSNVLEKLQVPELTHEEFLQESLKNGSYLTLYAYVLQKLPSCQNLNDELNILTKIVEWTTYAKPGPGNESKLILWWAKAAELCLRQVDYGAPHHYVIRTINNLAPALNVLGEDKDSSGLLGAIGLGRRSNLSLRIRLICRSLQAFLLAQTPGNSYLRTQPHAPAAISKHQRAPLPNQPNVHPTPKAQQALATLESLRNNKHYMSLRDSAYLASAFVTDPAHSLRDTSKLIAMLVNNLFPEKNYLAILRNDIYR